MNKQVNDNAIRNKIRKSPQRKIFEISVYILLFLVSLSCILPFVNLLAVSFSEGKYVASGSVKLIPKGFNFSSYVYILENKDFINSFFISIKRTVLGLIINVGLIVLTAYPLSKTNSSFKARSVYSWIFVGSMLFVPTLVPTYLVVRGLGLIDSIWALVLPGALPVFNMILMMNFFRELPSELEEASFLDGANHWTILWKIYVPLSKPAIATVTLFCMVNHWNAWFDGMLYMNSTSKYPLQSYLQTVVVNAQQLLGSGGANANLLELLKSINNDTAKAAQLFIAMIPVLCIYPFLQKYFTAGLTAGSVKG